MILTFFVLSPPCFFILFLKFVLSFVGLNYMTRMFCPLFCGKYPEWLTLFRAGKTQILVATDVAARGLGNTSPSCSYWIAHMFWHYLPSMSSCADVDDVKFVINYDFPGAVEDYIHRSFVFIEIQFVNSVLVNQPKSPGLVGLGEKATLAPPTPSSPRRTARTLPNLSTYSRRRIRWTFPYSARRVTRVSIIPWNIFFSI